MNVDIKSFQESIFDKHGKIFSFFIGLVVGGVAIFLFLYFGLNLSFKKQEFEYDMQTKLKKEMKEKDSTIEILRKESQKKETIIASLKNVIDTFKTEISLPSTKNELNNDSGIIWIISTLVNDRELLESYLSEEGYKNIEVNPIPPAIIEHHFSNIIYYKSGKKKIADNLFNLINKFRRENKSIDPFKIKLAKGLKNIFPRDVFNDYEYVDILILL